MRNREVEISVKAEGMYVILFSVGTCRQYVRPGSRTLDQIKQAKKNKILSQYKAIGYGQTPMNVVEQ
jgi:hypothetical protein